MDYVIYNNQKYTKGVTALKAVEKREGSEAAEKFYQENIYPTNLSICCIVTNQKLTYRTYKICGNRCGTAVNLLLRKHKDVSVVKRIVDETLFYVEELNGYYQEWSGMSTTSSKMKFNTDQKMNLYNKYILSNTKCRLSTCSKHVPYEHVALGSCCLLHYNRDLKLKKGNYTTDKLKYECKFDGERFTSLSRLTVYIKNKGWTEENYYHTFIDPTAEGKCKWCSKNVSFHNIENGYRNFCHNSSCNVLWHNAHEGRNNHGDKISKNHKENQNLPTQKGYWLKRGYTEDEAVRKVKERQQTNSLESIMKRNKCSKEEAVAIRKLITKKWMDSFPKSNFSAISQKLFWDIYEVIKDSFPKIYFATLNPITNKKDTSGKNHEFLIQTLKSSRRPDFFIPSVNKIIEFDGTYWHGEKGRGNKTKDELRDTEIIESLEDCKILHINENEYRKNPADVLTKCLDFVLKST